MRTARAVPRPFDCKKTMMRRTAFCSRQLSRMRAMRAGPMPLTSLRNDGLSSITCSVRSPNTSTIFFAYFGPMPFTRPEARYFSMPSAVVGGTARISSALNCSPCCGSNTQEPAASMTSPAVMETILPTTVARPRLPRGMTRSTAKPVSGLWWVTRSTEPVSVSAMFGHCSPIMAEVPRRQGGPLRGLDPQEQAVVAEAGVVQVVELLPHPHPHVRPVEPVEFGLPLPPPPRQTVEARDWPYLPGELTSDGPLDGLRRAAGRVEGVDRPDRHELRRRGEQVVEVADAAAERE